MIHIYGLKNCDTCRKARKTLAAAERAHSFHDLRADGLTPAQLTRWAAACGWEALLNRRGTTWRGLPDSDKAAVDQAKALTLMLDHPALIKRPIFEMGKQVLVGFDKTTQETLLAG